MAQLQESELHRRYSRVTVELLTGGMEFLVEQQGGTCLGISIRSSGVDTLLVIRAEFEGKRMVAFMGASTGASALYKANKQLRNGGVRWVVDQYA
jgi:hypothetical protein